MQGFKTVVACMLITAPMLAFSGAAHADSEGHDDRGGESTRVKYDYNVATSNFTNCPAVPAELTCTGTGIQVVKVKSAVGESESQTSTITVNEFEVLLHADGTFEIGDLIANGSGRGRLEFDGVRSASIKGRVLMDDGTTAQVRFGLTGTGPLMPYSGTASVDEPNCASGSADIAYSGTDRSAVTAGQLSIGGIVQVPTEAAGPARLTIERDRGVCSAP